MSHHPDPLWISDADRDRKVIDFPPSSVSVSCSTLVPHHLKIVWDQANFPESREPRSTDDDRFSRRMEGPIRQHGDSGSFQPIESLLMDLFSVDRLVRCVYRRRPKNGFAALR
jgi:hypothetical protein